MKVNPSSARGPDDPSSRQQVLGVSTAVAEDSGGCARRTESHGCKSSRCHKGEQWFAIHGSLHKVFVEAWLRVRLGFGHVDVAEAAGQFT
jgi:hypothetical protein